MVVGRLLSYWEGNFSGAMLNFGRVSNRVIFAIFFPYLVSPLLTWDWASWPSTSLGGLPSSYWKRDWPTWVGQLGGMPSWWKFLCWGLLIQGLQMDVFQNLGLKHGNVWNCKKHKMLVMTKKMRIAPPQMPLNCHWNAIEFIILSAMQWSNAANISPKLRTSQPLQWVVRTSKWKHFHLPWWKAAPLSLMAALMGRMWRWQTGSRCDP